MTAQLHDIKDKIPNPATVAALERLLEQARQGEVRTIAYILGYDDDAFTHGWVIDARSSPRRLLGQSALLNFDLLTDVAIRDGDTRFAGAVRGE